ncbi:MAG: 2-phospho-L-lactate transferase [Candidatus Hadarchaeales archaeon]
MITLLSGGTGTPKLLQGMLREAKEEDLCVVVNTGEDIEISGLRVSPDLDAVVYTLAGIINEETWWGIEGDTFETHRALERLGVRELLKLGDRDRATCLFRTLELERGKSLSQFTAELCARMGIRVKVLPMTDGKVVTEILTPRGWVHFQEFWVGRKGRERVRGVRFRGSETAEPAPGVLQALRKSEFILIGPSNPVTSIGPILSLRKIREELKRRREEVVVVSPILGRAPVSGPAGKLMKALGFEVSPRGVASYYREVAGHFFLHSSDRGFAPFIEDLGMKVHLANLWMRNLGERRRLARKILEEMAHQSRSS